MSHWWGERERETERDRERRRRRRKERERRKRRRGKRRGDAKKQEATRYMNEVTLESISSPSSPS